MDGITLLGLLTEYDRAIIVDAIQTGEQKTGYIYRINPADINEALHPNITHGIDLLTALELGSKLGVAMPSEMIIFAIEVSDISTLSETCTPNVQKAISVCAGMIVRELDVNHHTGTGNKNFGPV
jgi:hydrogenase maturation protease